jgi:hypothetical protein
MVCNALSHLTIAQRFNAGSRSYEEIKSLQGRKKRVSFFDGRTIRSLLSSRDGTLSAGNGDGPSVETLGYFQQIIFLAKAFDAKDMFTNRLALSPQRVTKAAVSVVPFV